MSTTISHNSLQLSDQAAQACYDELLIEKALQFIVNGEDFSMTMQTPGDELYLVRGLLHAEGISSTKFKSFHLEDHELGSVARITLEKSLENKVNRRLTSTSSCGLCGKRNFEKLFDQLLPVTRNAEVNQKTIIAIFNAVQKRQALFVKTGGSHAASAADSTGNILCVFEDIGRHNAVDKVIGYLLENDLLHKADYLTVSGRISFEIIQKCNRAGIPILASVSAPSSLAVKFAQKTGITLAAFCRGKRATFYSGFQRISDSNQVE